MQCDCSTDATITGFNISTRNTNTQAVRVYQRLNFTAGSVSAHHVRLLDSVLPRTSKQTLTSRKWNGPRAQPNNLTTNNTAPRRPECFKHDLVTSLIVIQIRRKSSMSSLGVQNTFRKMGNSSEAPKRAAHLSQPKNRAFTWQIVLKFQMACFYCPSSVVPRYTSPRLLTTLLP